MTVENPILQRAIEHFRSQALVDVEVPEWGEETAPLRIYAKPLTMAEKNILARSSLGNDLGILVDVIVMKAEDEDGEKLFSKTDKPHFMRHVDADVISRVAGEILRTDTVEDHLGNFNEAPSESS